MESVFSYSRAEAPSAVEWTSTQLAHWGVRSPFVDWWVAEGGRLLGDGRTGRLVLAYDPDVRLVSFDVWCEDIRVYGMDDVV
jgi:hypothetical protein